MAGSTDKIALVAELAVARHRLTEVGGELRASAEHFKEAVNIPARAKRSYAEHKGVWLAGAALLGFLLSRLPARQKVVYMERATKQKIGLAAKVGLVWPALKFVAGLAAPLVSKLVGARLGEIASRFIPREDSSQGPEHFG